MSVPTVPLGGLEKKIVLAVDDEPAVTLLISRVLSRAGYEVRTAASGEEGLEVLGAKGPVDLIIVDKNLPRMHGFDFAKAARTKLPHVPVIMITAAPEALGANQERIDGYLAKPFKSLDALRDAVAAAFERSRGAREREELQRRLSEVMAQLRKS